MGYVSTHEDLLLLLVYDLRHGRVAQWAGLKFSRCADVLVILPVEVSPGDGKMERTRICSVGQRPIQKRVNGACSWAAAGSAGPAARSEHLGSEGGHAFTSMTAPHGIVL